MLENWRADLARYKRYGSRAPAWRLFFEHQGLWAVACYRFGNHLDRHRLPPVLHQVARLVYHSWRQWVEMATGICISSDATIGPGLYIGHMGQIIVHTDAVIGRDCNLSQGVTIGLGQRDGHWGVPVIGDRVYVAPGAKVFGPIRLADGTVVGANAVLNRDTEENAVVAGNPAQVISHKGSGEYIV